jgi:hypothetical protein
MKWGCEENVRQISPELPSLFFMPGNGRKMKKEYTIPYPAEAAW